MAVSDDYSCYLQEDLGRRSLYDALREARENGFTYGERETELLERTIRLLPRFQIEGARGLDFDSLLPPVRFDRRTALFDLHYFKYSFLKTLNLPFDEIRLEDEFERFADRLVTGNEEHYFLYRDFQARNVMLTADDEPRFIDFQGGMSGPLPYDVASFLWQASARYPERLRERLLLIYIEALQKQLPDLDEANFRARLNDFVLFRTLQVLGAYGLRGFVERKAYFLNSIPEAVANLHSSLLTGVLNDFPYLFEVLDKVCKLPRFVRTTDKQALQASVSRFDGKGKLVVRVFSFSYKKGIPEDESGNGGGYVFDCRSTHNPGRYEPYKALTGLDEPVIRFLEENGEILTFLESVYRLADAHVERYLRRGFTDLMFSFGCTGGRHRSVYSAQSLARHLNERFGIEVRVCHREQGLSEVLTPRKSQ